VGVIVTSESRVVCFGRNDALCTGCDARMRQVGSNVVAMVGAACTAGPHVPRFDTAIDAVRNTGANAALVCVPPDAAADAIMEAVDAGLALIVCRARGVPARDMVKAVSYLQASTGLSGSRHNEGRVRLLGPGSHGVITPGAGMVGTFDVSAFTPGNVAIASRSNELAEATAARLTAARIGQSTCLATSAALIVPTRLVDVLGMFEADPQTEVIVLIGGLGGDSEFEAATFVGEAVTKPIIAYVPGASAPPRLNLGAGGDFASGLPGETALKREALRAAGAMVVDHHEEIADAIAERL
jgi:succinyl-CoA synthetase alpha subunit